MPVHKLSTGYTQVIHRLELARVLHRVTKGRHWVKLMFDS